MGTVCPEYGISCVVQGKTDIIQMLYLRVNVLRRLFTSLEALSMVFRHIVEGWGWGCGRDGVGVGGECSQLHCVL